MTRVFNKVIQVINLEEVKLKLAMAGYKNRKGIVTTNISTAKYKRIRYKKY